MDSLIVSAQYPWYPWECRGFPFTAGEEARFAADLRDAAGGCRAPYRRGDVTTVMNALRSGMPVGGVLGLLVGADRAALWGAYCALRAELAEANRVWDLFLDEPHDYLLARHSAPMSALLPIPFKAVVDHMRPVAEGEQVVPLADLVDDLRTTLAFTTARVARVEAAMVAASSEDGKRAIGYQLFNPFDEHEWQHPFFRPDRVGALSLMRVADLLGDTR